MKVSLRLMLVVALAGCLVYGQTARRGPQPRVFQYWNEIVLSIEEENNLFHELEDSYRRFKPGGVIVTPERREQLRCERVAAINRIIGLHESRIALLRRMQAAEAEAK